MARKGSPLTKPLKGKALRKELGAIKRLATRDERRVLQGEQRASREQSHRIKDYFRQYGSAVDKASTSSASAYSKATSQIGSDTQKAADYAETLRQRMASEEQADAAKRGVAYDPSGSHTGASASLARINAANVLSGVTSSQGATQSAYLADKKRIGEREGIEQQLREAARRRTIAADKKALARHGADVTIAERGRLRDSERDYKLGRLAAKNTQRGQNITAQNAKRSAAASRANSIRTAKNARRSARVSRRNSQRSARTSRQNSRRSNDGDSGSSGGGKARFPKSEVRKARSLLRQDTKPSWSRQRTVDYLITRGGVPPRLAKKVYSRAKKGPRSNPQFNRFH